MNVSYVSKRVWALIAVCVMLLAVGFCLTPSVQNNAFADASKHVVVTDTLNKTTTDVNVSALAQSSQFYNYQYKTRTGWEVITTKNYVPVSEVLKAAKVNLTKLDSNTVIEMVCTDKIYKKWTYHPQDFISLYSFFPNMTSSNFDLSNPEYVPAVLALDYARDVLGNNTAGHVAFTLQQNYKIMDNDEHTPRLCIGINNTHEVMGKRFPRNIVGINILKAA